MRDVFWKCKGYPGDIVIIQPDDSINVIALNTTLPPSLNNSVNYSVAILTLARRLPGSAIPQCGKTITTASLRQDALAVNVIHSCKTAQGFTYSRCPGYQTIRDTVEKYRMRKQSKSYIIF
jgi:hypothetical protein